MDVLSADSKCSHTTLCAALFHLSRHSFLSDGGSACDEPFGPVGELRSSRSEPLGPVGELRSSRREPLGRELGAERLRAELLSRDADALALNPIYIFRTGSSVNARMAAVPYFPASSSKSGDCPDRPWVWSDYSFFMPDSFSKIFSKFSSSRPYPAQSPRRRYSLAL